MTATLDPGFLLGSAAHRHAGFAALRHAPVHEMVLRSGEPAWLVTGYDEVRRALGDQRMVARTATVGRRRALPDDVLLGMNSHMLNCNPPDHTRLRRLVSAAFTRRRMEAMRPRVQQVTDDLLDGLAGAPGGRADLIARFALPLPLVVLSDLIGVPEEDTGVFHGWTGAITANDVTRDELDAASTAMLGYIRSLVERKRRDPAPDLLSALVAVRDGDDRLSGHELSSMIFLLLTAGHETTVNLIGNAVLNLLADPGQRALLSARPELLDAAVDETLRADSPVQVSLRTCVEPVETGGTTIPAGATVILALLAANRDPARFPEPDRFRIDRPTNPQLGFGYGFHHCIGAPLARIEAAVAVGSLLARFPGLRLDADSDDLRWRASVIMHGLEVLPVHLGDPHPPTGRRDG